mmetsp:Transcript_30990/g.37756  ORF Transcript_30990/g.37756 Transcript_30990/m.37756 type:complete len:89 (+) Transcript_30990:1361-1627(+)
MPKPAQQPVKGLASRLHPTSTSPRCVIMAPDLAINDDPGLMSPPNESGIIFAGKLGVRPTYASDPPSLVISTLTQLSPPHILRQPVLP